MVLRIVRRLLNGPSWLLRRVGERAKKRLCSTGPGVTLFPSSRIHNGREPSAITIGPNSKIYGTLQVLGHGGRIEIGEFSFVSENTNIWSGCRVKIGDRVLISHGVNIHDTSSHSLSARERHLHFVEICTSGHPKDLPDVKQQPIVIEDDAWIGFNSTILKGVTIGRGAVVGACSVVTKDVPPFTVVVGHPARPIGPSYP